MNKVILDHAHEPYFDGKLNQEQISIAQGSFIPKHCIAKIYMVMNAYFPVRVYDGMKGNQRICRIVKSKNCSKFLDSSSQIRLPENSVILHIFEHKHLRVRTHLKRGWNTSSSLTRPSLNICPWLCKDGWLNLIPDFVVHCRGHCVSNPELKVDPASPETT